MGSLVLLDLLGGVALLLWGLHMVLTGVLRAFGPDLRRFLGKALGNRFTAFGAGAGDVMAAVQMAMLGGLPYTAVLDAVIAHPTMPEGLISLFGNVPPISAHAAKRTR